MDSLASPPTSEWWRHAVVYEIYVRSFADADGDGLGDLEGIRRGLPALVDLGVDAVWLTPFFTSPQADGGYDVADYCDVDPRFGDLAAFDALIETAHDLGLRVLIDIVPNHSSDQHEWFRAALRAGPGSPERDRYIFRDGTGPRGDEPPNDWSSLFGGCAWERVTEADGTAGQWYLHLFAREQPDFDWEHPDVPALFEGVLRFWLDRGVDGFRIDVAHGLFKEPGLPDMDGRFSHGGLAELGNPHWDQDGIHDVYRSWRAIADEYDGDRVFVAEAYVRSAERLRRYVRPDELHTAFNFNLVHAPWDAAAFRRAVEDNIAALADVGSPPTWVISTHDSVRPVTRYGRDAGAGSGAGPVDLALGRRRARAASQMLLALPGVAYLYQGEELGLEEVLDLPDGLRADPVFARTGGERVGRDGCRVPLPWVGDAEGLGFGVGAPPWLPQPAGWTDLARDRQTADSSSTLAFYRQVIALRRELGLAARPFEWLADLDAALVAFRRDDLVSITNFADQPRAVPSALGGSDLILASTPASFDDDALAGGSTVWVRLPS